MTTFESVCKKMVSLDQSGNGKPSENGQTADAAGPMPPEVAHELNNLLTLVQGYADRLLSKHGANPALQPALQKISEAARRAALLIREMRSSDSHLPPPRTSTPPEPAD